MPPGRTEDALAMRPPLAKNIGTKGAIPARRLPWETIGVALLMIVALWTALIYDLRRSQDNALEQGRGDVKNLAIAFREHISGIVAGIDQLMIAIDAEHGRDRDGEYRVPDWVERTPLMKGLALQVSIARPDGIIAASTLPMNEKISIADRPHFKHHLNPSASEPHISVPVLGRVSKKWSVQFTRRLTRNGLFDGVVIVSVDPFYLSQFFGNIDLGRDSSAILVGRDGIVRARRAINQQELGQDLSNSRLFERLKRFDDGTYVGAGKIDGIERVYGFASLTNYPLVVGLGISTDELLSAVRGQTGKYVVGGWILTIAIVFLAFLFAREAGRRRQHELEMHAQAEITEQKAQLDVALENMSQGLVMFDSNQQVKVINHRYLQLYDLPADLVKPGCSIRELLSLRKQRGTFEGGFDEYDRWLKEELARNGRAEKIVHLRDGRIIRVLNQSLPDGGWVATHEDITEEEKATADLRTAQAAAVRAKEEAVAAHARLLDAFEIVPEGLALFDADDRYVMWNGKYAELYELSRDDIRVGMYFADVLRAGLAKGQYPDAVGREEAWLAERVARHQQQTSTHEQRLPSNRWVRIRERRTSDGGSIGVRVDITELKQRELLFRLLFEHNPVPMWVVGQENLRFLDVNESTVKQYGYSREQFLKMNLLDIRQPEDWTELKRVLESPDGHHLTGRIWRHIKADGSLMEVAVYSQPLQYQGRPAWLAVLIDMTERRQIERQLQQAQKMEAVGRLTGGLAHDFNNLLLVMIGNLDLLIEELADNDSARQKAEAVLQAGLRGAELNRRLLAFSRRQPLQPKLVNLNAVIDETIRLLRRTLGEAVQIEFKSTDSPAVKVDEAQFQSAIVNVAINARDAMPNGGRLIIETKIADITAKNASADNEFKPGRYAVVSITDTGTGMPADVLSRVFEPFFTTKALGSGTGLGLSMVYGFAKQSGGHITAQSEVGKGTVFDLYLPCIDPSAAVAIDDRFSTMQPSLDGELILAVDDDDRVRATAVSQLRQLGYRVLEADGAQAALKLLDEHSSIHLLFTDVVMPGGMDGKQLAALARAKHPSLKVLFTSGFPGTAGADLRPEDDEPLLSKPYRKADLADAIRNALAA